jgi:AraC family transcriptional regulator
VLAEGDGWSVSDVVCSAGPRDPRAEEQHRNYTIAVVARGSFQYRGGGGCGEKFARQVMTPGSLMLGSPGQCFECGHEHGVGDRCIAFWYRADFFERLVGAERKVRALRIPPLQATAGLVAKVCAGAGYWEGLAIRLAVESMRLTAGASAEVQLSGEARVTRVVRRIDAEPGGAHTLETLAKEAGLSPWHFLRVFESVTEVTPHQYLRRARLREAARRLCADQDRVLNIALDSGFGDVSNFNRAFRGEFGVSPLVWRGGKSRYSETAGRRV